MKIRVAITGLQRGDNPQPGAAIVRSLRRTLEVEIVGLVYDAYESGIYVEGGVDSAHVMPYPTCGAAAWLGRLDEVRAHIGAVDHVRGVHDLHASTVATGLPVIAIELP